jgi:hypothetical protein
MQCGSVMVDDSLPRAPRLAKQRDEHLEGVEDFLLAVRSLKIQNIFAAMNRFRVMRSVRMLDESAMMNGSDPDKGWMGFQIWLDDHPHPIANPEE